MTRNSEALELDVAISFLFFLVSGYQINISFSYHESSSTLKHNIAQFKPTPATKLKSLCISPII